MPSTTARGIQYPVVGDAVAPLATKFQSLATTADTAITNALGTLNMPFRSLANTVGFTHNSNGNWLTVTGWTGADGDPGNGGGIDYANGILTVSVAGLYAAQLTMQFEVNATGNRGARFLKTGAAAAGARFLWISSATDFISGTAWYLGSLSAGDTLTAQGFQSSGGSLALRIASSSSDNRLAIVRLVAT